MQAPFEVVDLIFQRLFPPQYTLDPRLALSQSSSLWQETIQDMLNTCLVSKTWYRAAIPFLYEHVLIRDGMQITLLLESLKSNLELPPFIKRMTLACYIHPNFNLQFESTLRAVVEVSHHIERFSWEMSAPLPPNFDIPIPTHITHLRLGGTGIGYELSRKIAANVKEQLVCLNMTFDTPPSIVFDPISFPLLEELFLDMQALSASNLEELERWEIPSLRRLTLMILKMGGLWMVADELGEFIERLPHLEYISVGSLFHHTVDLDFLQMILDSAPNLVHLGIRAGWWTLILPAIELTHPQLRWVDIWSQTVKEPEERGIIEEGPDESYLTSRGIDTFFTQEHFLCLQGIRWCDVTLRTSLPELPTVLSPELSVDDSEVSFAYGAHQIYQSRNYIGYHLDWEPDSGDEDDEDYVPPKESDVGSDAEDSDISLVDDLVIAEQDNAL